MKTLNLFFLILSLVACSKGSDQQSPSVAPPTGSDPGTVTGPLPEINKPIKSGPDEGAPTPTVSPSSTPIPTSTPSPSPTASPSPVPTSTPVALIWGGNGVCKEQCFSAAKTVAEKAGFEVRKLDQNTLKKDVKPEAIAATFKNAKVWITPGGEASKMVASIAPVLKTELIRFLKNGGGYVGWGAGADIAMPKIRQTKKIGLGLISGGARLHQSTSRFKVSIELVRWFKESRFFYREQGPDFFDLPSTVEVVGLWDDLKNAASIRAPFGSGRIWLSGFYPEAPLEWVKFFGLTDPDGSDESIAIEMIKWAASI